MKKYRLFIDPEGAAQFVRTLQTNMHGDMRRYYVAQRARALIVCRNDLTLETKNNNIVGRVVDATIGWDRGDAEFVGYAHARKRHSKATIYQVLEGDEYAMTLSQFVESAPKD